MKSNLRQPGSTTNISDDYETHLDRGSLGGTDLTDSYGTTVHAQLDDATVTIVDNSPDGSGGRYSRVTGPDGDAVESLHQSSVTADRGQRVNADDPIGESGASAYGSNYGTGGPHIHNHGVHANGVRFNLEPYYWFLNGGSQTASAGSTPTTTSTEGEDDMLEFMAEMPIQPTGNPNYPNPGALTPDGSKHTFYVVPSRHVFWHVKNNGQLTFYRNVGIRFIADQGADIMLNFRLLKDGESV